MALALLKDLSNATLPYTTYMKNDVQKVSRLVFAGLVEAKFRALGGRSDGYREPLEATITAITPQGWSVLRDK